MFKRICNSLASAIRALRKDESAIVNEKLSEYLSADLVGPTVSPFQIGELPGCHAGTFDAVLLRLLDWATVDPAPILWLTGPAGIGKTAVSRSLVTRWKSEGRSAALNAAHGDRNFIRSLIPIIACQIAQAIPELRPSIVKVMTDENPRSFKQQSSLQSQFDKFVLNPILQLKLSPARRRTALPILIVVDGLDECDDQKGRRLFLQTIFEAAPRMRRYLKFLVVSRPESDIRNFFGSTSVQDETRVIELSAFLTHTAPKKNMKSVSSIEKPLRNSVNDIDALFHNILSSSSSRRTSPATLVRLLSVILVCLHTDVLPLMSLNHIPGSLTQSDRFVESILDLGPESLQGSLSDLKSLLSFRRTLRFGGDAFHDIRVIDFCYGDLKEFLLDQSRSREFHVDLSTACFTVATGILRVLKDKGRRTKRRYWPVLEYDPRPAYHNCLIWCFERLTPDEDLRRAMMDYDPIDYLSSCVAYPSSVALFTFACEFVRSFEELLSVDDHIAHLPSLHSHLDRYLKTELDYWVPQNSNLMHILKASILPDHIDWESFRSSEEALKSEHEAISRRLNDLRVVENHLPYFLTWMFDEASYGRSTVEWTVCNFFYSGDRAGKYYFGKVC